MKMTWQTKRAAKPRRYLRPCSWCSRHDHTPANCPHTIEALGVRRDELRAELCKIERQLEERGAS
jgi:hypothetical protein